MNSEQYKKLTEILDVFYWDGAAGHVMFFTEEESGILAEHLIKNGVTVSSEKENKQMTYPIKFTDENKDTLLLDNLFAVDEYLEYADRHNMDVLFTITSSSSSVEYIYKFICRDYKPMFREVRQIAPDGLVLNPKINVLLWRDGQIKEENNK
jgi:hypothetical protein